MWLKSSEHTPENYSLVFAKTNYQFGLAQYIRGYWYIPNINPTTTLPLYVEDFILLDGALIDGKVISLEDYTCVQDKLPPKNSICYVINTFYPDFGQLAIWYGDIWCEYDPEKKHHVPFHVTHYLILEN